MYVSYQSVFYIRPNAAPKASNKPTDAANDDSDTESDLDIDTEGCIEPDADVAQQMGDSTKEPTEEECDASSELRSKAAAAYSDQKYEEAIAIYTEAILLNPTNALFYAKRGQAFLKQQRPNACIRDCDRALELNCDSAAAYKFRGRANRLLGNWEAAAKDLRQACKIDFDEEADEWLREVTPNAKKLEQHQIKQERRKAEKDIKERQERVRRAQEANKKAAEEQAEANAAGGGDDADQADLLSAFSDPEVSAAFQDIMTNPANITKYQNNPKVMKLVAKIGTSMGGRGGGGFPGGFPGMGGMGGGFGFAGAPPTAGNASAPKPPPPTDLQDDGLDQNAWCLT